MESGVEEKKNIYLHHECVFDLLVLSYGWNVGALPSQPWCRDPSGHGGDFWWGRNLASLLLSKWLSPSCQGSWEDWNGRYHEMFWRDRSLHGWISIGLKSYGMVRLGPKVQHEHPGLFPVQRAEQCEDARWEEEENFWNRFLSQTQSMSWLSVVQGGSPGPLLQQSFWNTRLSLVKTSTTTR